MVSDRTFYGRSKGRSVDQAIDWSLSFGLQSRPGNRFDSKLNPLVLASGNNHSPITFDWPTCRNPIVQSLVLNPLIVPRQLMDHRVVWPGKTRSTQAGLRRRRRRSA